MIGCKLTLTVTELNFINEIYVEHGIGVFCTSILQCFDADG